MLHHHKIKHNATTLLFYRHFNEYPVSLTLILALKRLQCRDTKIKISDEVLIQSRYFFLLYMGEYYLTSIRYVVQQTIFLSCSKIDLKIADRLRFLPKNLNIQCEYNVIIIGTEVT